jgi:monothiol glutaredoxin
MPYAKPPVHENVARAQHEFENDLVKEVSAIISKQPVVVIGVKGLMPAKRARQLLDSEQIVHHYLEYGSYLKGWRRRLALKIWVGWPTFPLVFIRGTFVGGASDLKALHASGELKKMLT